MRTLCAIAFLALLQYMPFADTEADEPPKIGEGVIANLSLIFDDSYSRRFKEKASEKNITKYFMDLVDKAAEYFHNKSIMVNFTVHTVKYRNDLLVLYDNGSINGMQTLEHMTQVARSEGAPNNSIFCHAVAKKIYAENGEEFNKYGLSDVATNSTFCQSPSAVVFLEFPGQYNPRSLVRGLGRTMGAHDRVWFDDEDKKAMKQIFEKCTKE
uniref:Putative rhipicephalus family xiii n=1 Tax=Rhipicephalus pulchellus TaxID=72859 RepID=L7LY87_RHIPC